MRIETVNSHLTNMAKAYPTFAQRLQSIMEKRSVTTAQLVEVTDLRAQAIHNYLTGKREPTWEAVKQLATASTSRPMNYANHDPPNSDESII